MIHLVGSITHRGLSEWLVVNVHDVPDLLPGRVELMQEEVSAVGAQHLIVNFHTNTLGLEIEKKNS